MRYPLALLVLAVGLGACGDDVSNEPAAPDAVTNVRSTPDSAAPDRSEPSTTFSASPITPATVPPESPPGFPVDPTSPPVVAAVSDLAGRLGIDPAEIEVVDARAVTWADSSLGCPEPGVEYLQRLVDGLLVVLGAGGRQYEYHGGDPLTLCEHPKAPSGA
jgi:hypothetical protein